MKKQDGVVATKPPLRLGSSTPFEEILAKNNAREITFADSKPLHFFRCQTQRDSATKERV